MSQELLALGDAIVRTFESDSDDDFVGKWMAHHLAEKITNYRSLSGDDKKSAEGELVALIFEFWKHRAHYPRGKAPFKAFHAVFRALESLDPKSSASRYYRSNFSPPKKPGKGSPTERFLEKAARFDEAARAIITYYIANAAKSAGDIDNAWLKAAKVLPAEDEYEFKIILVTQASIDQSVDAGAELKQAYREKLQRLRELSDEVALSAKQIVSEIDEELARSETVEAASPAKKRVSKMLPAKAKAKELPSSKKTNR